MELIITDLNGRQVRMLSNYNADFDLAGQKTFEVTLPAAQYSDDMTYGCRVFVAGTETGGLIGDIFTDTASDTVSLIGLTWRGLMSKKIIRPPAGADYKTVSGELNAIIKQVTAGMFGSLFKVTSAGTGKTIRSYSFDRYTTVLDGLEKMLKSVGYRLKFTYQAGTPGWAGWVEVGAVPIVDRSGEIELSQDNRLNFTIEDDRTGINHLIVGGTGELRDRVIVDLYVQADGTISQTPYYTGLQEIAEFYDFPASSDTAELVAAGEKQLAEICSKKTFRMNVERLDLDIDIGDIIGGRDYITGLTVKKALINKIITITSGQQTIDYIVEGE